LIGPLFSIAQQELDVERTFSTAGFTTSENGVIIFQSTLDSPTQLGWFDRSGNEVRSLSDTAYKDPSFSPDGRYIAVSSDDARNGKYAVRAYDLDRGGVSIRLTEPGEVSRPIWSSNGKQITYASTQGKISYLYRIPADGSAPPETIRKGPVMLPNSWSPHGQLVFMTAQNGLPFL
jgi:Tol biopolymer transport system component